MPFDRQSNPMGPKAEAKLLSMFLKAIVMTVVTSLFFLFLGVAAILLLNLCLAGGALRRRLRTHRPLSSNGLSPHHLHKLPLFRFPESDPDTDKDCVVCLDKIRHGQWCRTVVGCGHVFHRRCVDVWLVKVAACPICRARVGPVLPSPAAYDSIHLWPIYSNSIQ